LTACKLVIGYHLKQRTKPNLTSLFLLSGGGDGQGYGVCVWQLD